MGKFHSVVVASGIVMTAAVGAWAGPQEPRPQPPATTAPATVEGCLYKEVDVPGRHVPEEVRSRTVTDEDYVLAKAQVIKGSAPAATAGAKPGEATSERRGRDVQSERQQSQAR